MLGRKSKQSSEGSDGNRFDAKTISKKSNKTSEELLNDYRMGVNKTQIWMGISLFRIVFLLKTDYNYWENGRYNKAKLKEKRKW